MSEINISNATDEANRHSDKKIEEIHRPKNLSEKSDFEEVL